MKNRIVAAALLFASCGLGSDPAHELPKGERIACAVDGAAALEPACGIERSSGPEGTSLTVRHPSGAFRRLLITTDGRGVVAADGADPALVTLTSQNRIEVAVAGDRYLLPATIKNSR